MSEARETTMDERMRWDVCPVCGAPDGEYCYAEVGVHLGVKANGARMKTGEGVHLQRLQAAPMRVRLVRA